MLRFFRELPYIIRYLRKHKAWPNFRKPEKFSEKIFRRMIHPDPAFSVLADKLAVRDYIGEHIGREYLPRLILATKVLTRSQFEALPPQFVMKSNHASGQVKIVTAKEQVSFDELSKLAADWLSKDFSRRHGEKHYKNITPSLIFEELLVGTDGPIEDYKFHAFTDHDGKLTFGFFQHIGGRGGKLEMSLYDTAWRALPFQRLGHTFKRVAPPKRDHLETMIRISETLCRPFGYLRVDFYIHDDRVLVGELTFTPAAGGMRFTEPGADAYLGRLWAA